MKDCLISLPRIKLLHPYIKNKVIAAIEEYEKSVQDKAIRVTQGLRSFEEQSAIFNQPFDGKDNNGNGKIDEPAEKVSNAKSGQSAHNYGLAFDICVLSKDFKSGSFVYVEKKAWSFDKKLIATFKKYGFKWGGDFKSISDEPHWENTFGKTWQQLKVLHESKKFISGTKFVEIK